MLFCSLLESLIIVVSIVVPLIIYHRWRQRVDIRQADGVGVSGVLEGVQLVVHHAAVLEAQAVHRPQRGARPRRAEGFSGVQERAELFLLVVLCRRLDYGWLHVSGVGAIDSGLSAVVVTHQLAVRHGVIDGVVDRGAVVRFEGRLCWAEQVAFGVVDGHTVAQCVFLFLPE